jgi:hypothetical protein
MNHLSFKRDFAYKFVKDTSFIKHQETSKIILPLWKLNRLSIIRGYLFLESFFKEVTLKKKSTIKIKYKHADKKTHQQTIFFFHVLLKDTHFFIFLLNYLPEPRILITTTGYVLIYPFYHFVLQIPCNEKNSIFVYKIIPYIKLLDKCQDISKSI